MSSSDHEEQVDPRARWRHLPAEPTSYVEETHVDGSSPDHAVPNVDPAQDFTRLYGG